MDEVIHYLNLMRNGATLQVKTRTSVAQYRWSNDAGLILISIGRPSWHVATDELDEFFLMLQTQEIEVIGGPVEEPPKPVSHVRRVEL